MSGETLEYVEENFQSPIKFMVCNDGSPASELALRTISEGLLRDIDKLYVATAWSHIKEEYLHYNYRIDYIRE
jgi:hypothetical protein